ncbi:hypothetical protein CORC01_05981 [Colletotrichum orchidophilum]|uniref:Uncharacterized protein n=1 Tax=Colletotrichum orchidophilum TaxID=1209926 RepID=A0A1G4BBK1_9PEZI|nr:uncharacterized protein CORC01_05981 [Colletotrichum orchidophilum]OHE98715.1 hypothetical protein CORC01_05981 [Colletotrichum orchidophilum]
MCQNVFYTYACQHVECVTYDCTKGRKSIGSGCIHRQPSQHTSLTDQLCHDCSEMARKMRQRRLDAKAMRHIRDQTHRRNEMMAQAQLQGSMNQQQSSQNQQSQQTQQAQQPQSRQDQQSISPNGKTVRPLESNKLANMDPDCDSELGLPPHRLYQLHVAEDLWHSFTRSSMQ